MGLPEDTLHRTPEVAVRRVCLALLDEAQAAAERLDDPEDSEALHDFRVAVRRLRSTFGAWRDVIGKPARKKHRKALRRLQNATGGGRDAEVALEWLQTQGSELNQAQRVGLDWITDLLSTRKTEGYRDARGEVRGAFYKVEKNLRRPLTILRTRIDVREPRDRRTYAEALAERLRAHARTMLDQLDDIRGPEDERTVHSARIAGKRLRYLLEPARQFVPSARGVVKTLKGLQDVLGVMHDCVVLSDELARGLTTAVAQRAERLQELTLAEEEGEVRREVRRTERTGLLELGRRVHARLEDSYERLEEDWLGAGAAAFVEDIERVAAELEASVRPAVEIERKYLLSAVPDRLREVAAIDIDQGWLPGTELRERLRHVRDNGHSKYVRTVKLGRGIERVEIEEEATEQVFDALWPLTEGCRVQKRRYRVAESGRVWEIDEFTDRELVLAEIELDAASEVVEIPEWLERHVVREVTGEDAYVNLNLAR